MKIINNALLLLIATLAVGCELFNHNKVKKESNQVKRTLIIYINADNNLYDQVNNGEHYGALMDINEMENAWNDSFEGTLLVYLNTGKRDLPKIYRIKHDDDPNKINSPVVYTYPDKVDGSSHTVLSRVIKDSREIAPAENFAMILWSHGTGWVPKSIDTPLKSAAAPDNQTSASQNEGISSYSFGSSDSYSHNQMDIDSLASALPTDLVFDYIAFDACYMGGIEVAYQLRKSCRYFIGSAVETPIDGFEYDLAIEEMISADLGNLIRKHYEYYASLSDWWQTCAISVVDCQQLETLAAATKKLITNSPKSLSDIRFNSIQDLGSSYRFRSTYYDFGDFINKTWADAPDLAAFNIALTNAVPHKYHLPNNLGSSYTIQTYSGFSCFAPKAHQTRSIQAFRKRFAWSEASGIGSMN